MHGAGLVHSDLKGNNARMALHQEIKQSHLTLVDLGSARLDFSSEFAVVLFAASMPAMPAGSWCILWLSAHLLVRACIQWPCPAALSH